MEIQHWCDTIPVERITSSETVHHDVTHHCFLYHGSVDIFFEKYVLHMNQMGKVLKKEWSLIFLDDVALLGTET